MSPMQKLPPTNVSPSVPSPAADRLETARRWVAARLGGDLPELRAISGDASFRRYYRLHTVDGSLVLMDAPPEREDSAPFVDIAGRLSRAGLGAPRVFHFDLEQGFGLLEDLGDLLYRDVLTPDNAEAHFGELFGVLARMAMQTDCEGLPPYDDARLQTELDLFTGWYLRHHRNYELSAGEETSWQALCRELRRSAGQQPRAFVHRDFHSCNLLSRPGQAPGIIDFQDAVRGPISYDFISLLWDRYISWPRETLERWMESYREVLELDIRPADWIRYCDLMGLQRNLKIVGIFSRLHYRDGKAGYIEMLPRFKRYILDVVSIYPEFDEASELLEHALCAP